MGTRILSIMILVVTVIVILLWAQLPSYSQRYGRPVWEVSTPPAGATLAPAP